MTRPERGETWLALVLILIGGFLMGFRPVAGMDYHFHLAMGRAHLAEGPRLSADPMTMLPVIRPSDMGAWGAATLFAWLDRLGGTRAVQILFGGLTALFYFLVWRVGRRLTGSAVLAFLVVSVAAAASMYRLRLRPDLFTLVAVVALFELIDREPNRRRHVLIFLLCAVWVQFHPGVLIAPFLAGLRALAPDWRRRLWQPVVATAGLCLSPRGPLDSIDLAVETARCRDIVPEWSSLWEMDPSAYAGEMFLFGAVLGFVVWALSAARGSDRGRLAFALGTALLPIRGFRLLYLTALALALALRFRHSGSALSLRARRVVSGMSLLIIVAMPLRDRVDRALRCRQFGLSPFAPLYEPNYPVAAADFLARAGLEGPVYSPVRWGGYLGLRLAPNSRMAHDGRVSLYGRELAGELLEFDRSAPARAELTRRFAFEILVMEPGVMTAAEMVDPRQESSQGSWIPVFSDPVAVVFVHREGAHAEANRERLRR